MPLAAPRHALLLLALLGGLLPVTLAQAQTSITGVVVDKPTPALHERVEITFQLGATYANPFDLDEVDARAVFSVPGGGEVSVPAFFHMEYSRQGTSPERIVDGRDPSWKVRFAAREAGPHSFRLEVEDASGLSVLEDAGSFTAVDEGRPGFIGVDPLDGRFLRRTTGEPMQPIGRNIAWADNRGIGFYELHLPVAAAARENYVRIWMTNFFQGQTLEWSVGSGYPGVGRYALDLAWKLDRIIELAEASGMAVMIALQHHGQFSTEVNPQWADNPYNAANASSGGFLATPEEFFSNAQARELMKRKLRYIIARWGYSTSVLAWELFNEVQFTDSFRQSAAQRAVVADWHAEMAAFLKANDPFGHLVTTSSDSDGFEAIWSLPTIDIVQHHDYSADKVRRFRDVAAHLEQYGKPILMSEFGADGGATGSPELNIGSLPPLQASQLLDGLVLRNGLWSAAMLRTQGHYWWWEYILGNDLAAMHTPLALYLEGEDLGALGLDAARARVLGGPASEGLAIDLPTTNFFSPSTQVEFDVQEDGSVPGIAGLSEWLHGNFQSALRSDPTFNVFLEEDGPLRIRVLSMSTAGLPQRLQVVVDGVARPEQVFNSAQSNVTLSFPLAAGQRRVQVRNNGNDWFRIDWLAFDGFRAPQVRALGLANNERAFLWLYDANNRYGVVGAGLLEGLTLEVPGLGDGEYLVEFHDTRPPGGVLSSLVTPSVAGVLHAPLPPFTGDIAVKVLPLSSRFQNSWLLH